LAKTKPAAVPSGSPCYWVRLLKYKTNILCVLSETMGKNTLKKRKTTA
jgi:hypothetical protein